MKMEHALSAPFDGVVGELPVRVGDTVAIDALLATVEAPAEAPVETPAEAPAEAPAEVTA
ncbi:biotin/lipoyl-containing protein [Streptomyces sp. NPDC055078]